MDATTAATPGTLPQDLGSHLRAVWQDQIDFNLELRAPAVTEDERCARTSDMVLHLMDECHELLRCVKWKKHRRQTTHLNPAHRMEEFVDIFKMFMTTAQIWDITPDALLAAYWDKSAVVRQRHAEEWIRDSQRPSAVIDLDNVLANFSEGMSDWLYRRRLIDEETRVKLITGRPWIDGASAGVTDPTSWAFVKHDFNSSGGFRMLPPMPGARWFAQWCANHGWNVVILTSRPIDRYPNILTDTIWWLRRHQIHHDFVWWGVEKDRKLRAENVLPHVKLAVDDDSRYVEQLTNAGVRPVFWFRPDETWEYQIAPSYPHTLRGWYRTPSFDAIMEQYDGLQ